MVKPRRIIPIDPEIFRQVIEAVENLTIAYVMRIEGIQIETFIIPAHIQAIDDHCVDASGKRYSKKNFAAHYQSGFIGGLDPFNEDDTFMLEALNRYSQRMIEEEVSSEELKLMAIELFDVDYQLVIAPEDQRNLYAEVALEFIRNFLRFGIRTLSFRNPEKILQEEAAMTVTILNAVNDDILGLCNDVAESLYPKPAEHRHFDA